MVITATAKETYVLMSSISMENEYHLRDYNWKVLHSYSTSSFHTPLDGRSTPTIPELLPIMCSGLWAE